MRTGMSLKVGVVTLAVLLLAAAPAGARIVREASSFVPVGVERPTGVAVEQATGDIFVVGEASYNVEKFTPSGEHITSFVSPVFESEPEDVAVDNSSGASKGDVYVTGLSMHEVVKLDSTGGEAPGFTTITASSIPAGDPGSERVKFTGVAVDPENGDVVVVDRDHSEVDIFSSAGTFISQFSGTSGSVSVGLHHQIFTADESVYAREWIAPLYENSIQIGPEVPAFGIAVDMGTGHVFVEATPEPREIVEYEEVAGTWTPTLHFGSGLIEYSSEVAVSEAAGTANTVYAASAENGTVEVFAPKYVASANTGSATDVTSTSAEVSGSVEPEGTTVTSCSVEFGLSESYGYTAPCSPEPPYTTKQSLSASLTGLQPGELYHYRLVVKGASGLSEGEDETFTTPPAAPAIADESVSTLTQTSATLGALVNPDNQATTYRFEYGTSTAYGSVLPVPDGSVGSGYGNIVVGQKITGLAPGTTYHFRVVATNGSSGVGGTPGPDQTFTTPPIEPPVVATGQAVSVSQNGATLTGTINTEGYQTDYEFDFGTDTGYGVRIFGDAGIEAGVHTFSVVLQDLAPGTTYYYRIAATNKFGTSYGAGVTFTTSVYPTASLSMPVTPSLLPAILLAPEPAKTGAGKAKAASVTPAAHAAGHDPRTRKSSGRKKRHDEHGRGRASHGRSRGNGARRGGGR
jgi:hypothetical protein